MDDEFFAQVLREPRHLHRPTSPRHVATGTELTSGCLTDFAQLLGPLSRTNGPIPEL
jgi:hypothetical protein